MHQALFAVALSLACPVPLQPTRTAFVTTVWIGSAGPLRFLVDTGATTTVIDRSVAQRIGLQPTRTIAAVSTTGTFNVEESMLEELRAGNVWIAHTPVLITELPRFPNHGHLDGILGMSFFAGRAVLLDIRKRCLEVDASPSSGTMLNAHEVVGRVAVEIDGLNFILDSGASFPVLTSPRARALALDGGSTEITSAAGRQRLTTATIPVFRIGRMTFRDVAVAIAPTRDAREDGLLPITAFDAVYIAADRKSIVVK
jgi:predicted aspartyl protease